MWSGFPHFLSCLSMQSIVLLKELRKKGKVIWNKKLLRMENSKKFISCWCQSIKSSQLNACLQELNLKMKLFNDNFKNSKSYSQLNEQVFSLINWIDWNKWLKKNYN